MEWVFLLVLGAVWGGSFFFLRIASPELGPFVVTALRLYLAGFCFFIYVVLIQGLSLRNLPWKKLFLLGLLNTALPFTLIATGEVYLTASLGSILNATTPIFTMVLATFFLKERLTLVRVMALIMGFLGVVIIMGWHPLTLTPSRAMAILCCLLGALFYGIGGIYASKTVKGFPPTVVAFGQILTSAIILTPFALFSWPHEWPNASVIGSLLGLGVLSTALAYFCYFHLMKRVGPTKTLTVTYLIPIFGILWGTLFLKESVAMTSFLGLALVLSGVLVLNLLK